MKLKNAKGVRDFLPEQKIVRDEIVATLKEVFELYGFSPLETPALEMYDLLASKYAGGDEILKEIFKLKDQGGRDLALRYDLTVPLARVVGMNPQLKMPFKRYQIDRAWRDGPTGLGRYREFWQCDVDVVGPKDMLADAEFVLIIVDVFNRWGLDVVVKINNRKLLNGILRSSGVDENKITAAIMAIDKLGKLSQKEVNDELRTVGVLEGTIKKLNDVFSIKGTNEGILNKVVRWVKDEEGMQGLKELQELIRYLDFLKVKNAQIDLSLARGLGYYTGTVYETFLKDSRIKSAVCSGGRFDKMIGLFLGTGKDYPAVGISFGLDRIYDALVIKNKAEQKTVTRAYVIPIKTVEQSLKIVQDFRQAEIKVDIDLLGRGISKNLNYANSLKIPFVILVGETELKQNKVKLRDMQSGEEKLLTIKEAIKLLQ
jgi:histidyl-tRNA synthetase